MSHATPRIPRLAELPLWRLSIALEDAERVRGPSAPATRALSRELRARLRGKTSPAQHTSLRAEGPTVPRRLPRTPCEPRGDADPATVRPAVSVDHVAAPADTAALVLLPRLWPRGAAPSVRKEASR